jgi:hypothetical protein
LAGQSPSRLCEADSDAAIRLQAQRVRFGWRPFFAVACRIRDLPPTYTVILREAVVMVSKLKALLGRITGVSTPFGGLQWDRASTDAVSIARFDGTFCITMSANDAFIGFLESNDSKVVFLNAYLDASVALEEQWDRVEQERIDLDLISSGRFSGISLPLPNRADALTSAVFHFLDGHVLTPSSGGTGTLMVNITGFFEVSRTFHGGPSMTFHLKEIEASLTLKAKFMTGTRGSASN